MNKKDIELLTEAYVGDHNLRGMANVQSDELEVPERTDDYDNVKLMMQIIDAGLDISEWKINPVSKEKISPEEINTAYQKIQSRDMTEVR